MSFADARYCFSEYEYESRIVVPWRAEVIAAILENFADFYAGEVDSESLKRELLSRGYIGFQVRLLLNWRDELYDMGRLWRLKVAVELFRRQNGRLPASQEELPPEVLENCEGRRGKIDDAGEVTIEYLSFTTL